MAWDVNPTDYGAHLYILFSQGQNADREGIEEFPWMKSAIGGTTAVTKAGCCMAFTVFFFDWYRSCGGPDKLGGYFKWVQSVKGVTSIMNLQTKYLGWRTHGPGQALTQEGGGVAMVLGALRRKVENETYSSLGFASIDSPTFPSFLGSLASSVTKDFNGHGCVYKPVYLASLSGEGHAVGAILDYDNACHLFFDSNHGLAGFVNPRHMRAWLVKSDARI
jgi:hypothetical protein